MGIIKWWNDRKSKQLSAQEVAEPKPELSDIDRVTNYFASGGEIVDLSNKERLPNDGFASDQVIMQEHGYMNNSATQFRKDYKNLIGRR